MNRERLVQIGKFLNCRLIIHRNVENDIPWTTEEKMIRELYDNYLDLLKQNQNLEQALDEIEKYIEEYQEERTYTDRGGFTCVDGHFLRDSDYLLEIIKKAKGDVKNEN